jgi:hypothetical protein
MTNLNHKHDNNGRSNNDIHHSSPMQGSSFATSDDVACMLKQLTREELVIAARTDYEYVKSSHGDHGAEVADVDCKRRQYASAMAQRYLNSKTDKDRALQFMKATIQFRKEMDIDGLRDAATDPSSEYHSPLIKFLSTKQSFVQGYDKQGRSTYVFVPRLVQEHDLEWTLKGHVWSLERAIACSKAQDNSVNFVVDFTDFSVWSHAPPTSIGKEIMLALRNHYVGHVHRILLVNAPDSFSWLWSFFKNFAGTKTRDKIHFVKSDEEKEVIIGELYCSDQATSWMLPKGEKNRELDPKEYLNAPFDQGFDE